MLLSLDGAVNNIFTQGREAKDNLLKIELAAKKVADGDFKGNVDKLSTKQLLKKKNLDTLVTNLSIIQMTNLRSVQSIDS